MIGRLIVALGLVVACACAAHAQVDINCDFQDVAPYTCDSTLSSGMNTDTAFTRRTGAEANGLCTDMDIGWQETRSASGGLNDAGYGQVTQCDHDDFSAAFCTHGVSCSHRTGYAWTPPGTNTWPDEFYFTVALNPTIAMSTTGPSDGQLKWFIWNQGVSSSDRAVMMFERGDNGGVCSNAATLVCFLLRRNIQDNVRIAVPVNAWTRIQGRWKYGSVGTSRIILWKDSCNEGSPDADDSTLDENGGDPTWDGTQSGHEAGFDWGNRANQGTHLTEDWPVRFSHLRICTSFDAMWCSGGAAVPINRFRGPRSLKAFFLDALLWLQHV